VIAPDRAVFAAAQGGDPLAIDQLLRQLQPDIRRYARRQCHRASAIEDVVQEALIVVYRRVRTVRDPAALAGWLLRVVGRLCMLPAVAWLRRTEDDVSAEEERAIAQRPSDDLRLDLARALESLPAIYREVILLRDMEQLTIGETAERLEITREATKSRLHRARELVREYLKGWGAERGMDAGSGPA
jgi:RNA polymerase sigma factor (sigma-70 family)